MKKFNAIFLLFSISFSVHANVVDYEDINRDIFRKYITNVDQHPDVNPVTLWVASTIIEETGMGKVRITSSCRKAGYHHMSPDGTCSAIDFTSVEFTGNLREDVKTYIEVKSMLTSIPMSTQLHYGLHQQSSKRLVWGKSGLPVRVEKQPTKHTLSLIHI